MAEAFTRELLWFWAEPAAEIFLFFLAFALSVVYAFAHELAF